MSSGGDDCQALSEKISSTLNCDDSCSESREICGSISVQNEETQKKVDDCLEKCSEEENLLQVVIDKEEPCSDEQVVQLLETDSGPEDTAGFPRPAAQENQEPFEMVPRSLACVINASFVSGDQDEEDDDEED